MSTTPNITPALTPITVLTGFLGSGKTTLLNRILTEKTDRKYAVIINEYGLEGIDDKLITAQIDEEVFEMNNGCICCTVRGDLIRILSALMRRRDKFDAILLETTGLADPAPVAQTFFADPDVKASTELDSILTMVDAAHIVGQLASSPEATDQIAFADTIVINKIDAVLQPEREAAEAAVRAVNPFATILYGDHGKLLDKDGADVPLDFVLTRHAFSLQHVLGVDPEFLANAAEGHHHHHDADITSISLTSTVPLSSDKFDDWMGNLLATRGQTILRTKGILNIDNEPKRFVFQAVHMMSDGEFTTEWKPDEKRTSTLVLIGRNLNKAELKAQFAACAA